MSDVRYRKVEVEPIVQNDVENPGPSDLVNKESLRLMKSKSRKEQGLINYDIAWSGVNFKVGEKVILNNCYGSVPAGTVCAVLGPSGSGKSSLLNVLAGRSASTAKIFVDGTVTVAHQKINPVSFRQHIAYVMQDDSLTPTATPREALEFSANLRLPPTTTKAEIKKLVQKTLIDLGLDVCADVMIGGALIKGISGGQRKRTSIGVEIITDPSILFLDEPTSGLDSFSAQSCITLLTKIAIDRHSAIMCTIHQPSSDVFVLFDQVIFMKEGRIFYQGSTSALIDHFKSFGYNCPTNYNPADYVMLLSQTESMESIENVGIMKFNTQAAIEVDSLIQKHMLENDKNHNFSDFVYKPNFLKQSAWLLYREFTTIRRDTGSLIARFAITLFLSLLFGLIYFKAGSGDNGNTSEFQAHFGAVTFVTISAMFGGSQPVLLSFPSERPVFLREYSTGTYTAVAYFISKTSLELPLTFITQLVGFLLTYFLIDMQGNFGIILGANFGLAAASCSVAVFLGCVVKDIKDATELSTLLFVPQLLFSGFFINTELIPQFLRWAQYLCSLKYALNLVLMTEFDASQPNCQSSVGAKNNCASVLSNNTIDPYKWWFYTIMLIVLFTVFRAIGSVALVQRAKRFY